MLDFLASKGLACAATREPGGTQIGQKIRAILLDPENKDMEPMVELLLYIADRAQHVQEIILPLLSAGKTVICDRYYDATVVYQGFARGIHIDVIHELHKSILNNLKPDITILLDLPSEIGLSRAWKQIESGDRADLETRFEEETLAFHEKVRSGYLELARLEPGRFRVVDASRNENQVRAEVINILSAVLDLENS